MANPKPNTVIEFRIERIFIPEDEMRQYAICYDYDNMNKFYLRLTQLMRVANLRTGDVCKAIISEDGYPVKIFFKGKEYILRFGNSCWVYDPETNTEAKAKSKIGNYTTEIKAHKFNVYKDGRRLRTIIYDCTKITTCCRQFRLTWSKQPEFVNYLGGLIVEVLDSENKEVKLFEM